MLCVTIAAALAGTPSARDQTFVVQAMRPDGKADIGSGVVIDRQDGTLTVATAAHVLEGSQTYRILDVTRRAYYDVVDVRVVPAYDLAFLRLRAQKGFPADAAAFAKPVTGEHVWVWGNTVAGFWEPATGTVQSADAQLPERDGARRITIACERCGSGDSGSGVFDEDGKLLGILTAGWRKPGGPIEFFEVQPVSVIQELLKAPPDIGARNP